MANSCRCSVGGETIRLSSQSSRVPYTAPLPFFSCFFFFLLFVFLFFFSMGGGILCMYVFFLCATHHPPVITTAVLRGVPTLRAHSAHTHRPGAHGLLEVPCISSLAQPSFSSGASGSKFARSLRFTAASLSRLHNIRSFHIRSFQGCLSCRNSWALP